MRSGTRETTTSSCCSFLERRVFYIRICSGRLSLWTLQWVAHGLPFMRSQLDATKACPDVWSQGIAYIIASSYLSMFAQLWLAMKTQSMWRQERCAQLNCSKPVLPPRDLFCSRQHWMTRIPIRNFWTHKRPKNLYKLAGESGSQVARAHSCLTGRLAQTSFMAMQFGVFLAFLLASHSEQLFRPLRSMRSGTRETTTSSCCSFLERRVF